jgi:hypothetical protein
MMYPPIGGRHAMSHTTAQANQGREMRKNPAQAGPGIATAIFTRLPPPKAVRSPVVYGRVPDAKSSPARSIGLMPKTSSPQLHPRKRHKKHLPVFHSVPKANKTRTQTTSKNYGTEPPPPKPPPTSKKCETNPGPRNVTKTGLPWDILGYASNQERHAKKIPNGPTAPN